MVSHSYLLNRKLIMNIVNSQIHIQILYYLTKSFILQPKIPRFYMPALPQSTVYNTFTTIIQLLTKSFNKILTYNI
jgi:hypothetical protein